MSNDNISIGRDIAYVTFVDESIVIRGYLLKLIVIIGVKPTVKIINKNIYLGMSMYHLLARVKYFLVGAS